MPGQHFSESGPEEKRYIAMKINLILLTTIVLTLNAIALAQDSSECPKGLRGFSMGSSFQFDGKEYRYELDTDAIKDTPSWDISESDPPLSVPRAVEIGKIQLEKLIKNTKGWDVDVVSLHQADRRKWYYNIHFSCMEPGCSDKVLGGFTILVKMDGVPVEPKIAPVPKPKPY
jgi:hypothetical protein